MSIDTTQYYKLSTRQLGDGFALESTDPGGRPLMTRWADEAGQLWRLTPRGAYYQLSSLYNGEAYGLEGGAPGDRAHNMAFTWVQGQLWKLVPQPDGWYRLTNMFMETTKRETFALDGGAAGAGSLLSQAGDGLLWKLTPVQPVTPNVAVPSVTGGETASDIPAIGKVTVYVVCVDFSDAPGSVDEIPRLRDRMLGDGKLIGAFSDQSYGKMKLDITWGTTWRRMPKPITAYVPGTAGWDYTGFVRDAVSLVPKDVPTPQIVVAAVPETPKFSPSSGAHSIVAGDVRHEINLSGVTYGEHYTTLMHELGHCLGLADLYPFVAPWIHKVGPWDVMGDIVYATGFLGWHRKVFGWLDANRMTVLKSGDVWNAAIAPMSSKYGTCMVTVRPPGNTQGDPNSLYVIQVSPEVRGRDGTVLAKEANGLLVYKVRAPGPADTKPLEVIPYGTVSASDSSRSLIAAAPFPAGHIYDRPELPFTLNIARRTGDAYYVDIHVR